MLSILSDRASRCDLGLHRQRHHRLVLAVHKPLGYDSKKEKKSALANEGGDLARCGMLAVIRGPAQRGETIPRETTTRKTCSLRNLHSIQQDKTLQQMARQARQNKGKHAFPVLLLLPLLLLPLPHNSARR